MNPKNSVKCRISRCTWNPRKCFSFQSRTKDFLAWYFVRMICSSNLLRWFSFQIHRVYVNNEMFTWKVIVLYFSWKFGQLVSELIACEAVVYSMWSKMLQNFSGSLSRRMLNGDLLLSRDFTSLRSVPRKMQPVTDGKFKSSDLFDSFLKYFINVVVALSEKLNEILMLRHITA